VTAAGVEERLQRGGGSGGGGEEDEGALESRLQRAASDSFAAMHALLKLQASPAPNPQLTRNAPPN
jgi:hypothetical protein